MVGQNEAHDDGVRHHERNEVCKQEIDRSEVERHSRPRRDDDGRLQYREPTHQYRRRRPRTTAPCSASCARNVAPAKLIPMASDRSETRGQGNQRADIAYIETAATAA